MEQMIAEQRRTTDAILVLADTIKNQRVVREIVHEIEPEKVSTSVHWTPSGQSETLYTREKIVEAGKTYTRDTHSLLFAVVDWLEENPVHRDAGVRPIAATFEQATGTSVSKSWAAVAKNYWKANSQR